MQTFIIDGEAVAKEENCMSEIWKDIEGYEGLYQVSNRGRVKSLERIVMRKNGRPYSVPELIKERQIDHKGYDRIGLNKNGKKKRFFVHRLVLQAFNQSSDETLEVNHIDGNKLNNNVENLEWVTSSENSIHAFENNLHNHQGERNTNASITDSEAKEIKKLKGKGLTQKEVGEMFGTTNYVVANIWNRRGWTHV